MMLLLIVTGVGGAIHIYSFGYMRERQGSINAILRVHEPLYVPRCSGSCLLANNFLQMFIFWKLVWGFQCLLVVFGLKNQVPRITQRKQITNRLGDFGGFMLGILMNLGTAWIAKFYRPERHAG